jgi:ParB/RepB/Spo0J family partition protein
MPRPKIVHTVQTIPLALIDRNPGQPRRVFREDKLRELAISILDNGMAQLPTVRANPSEPGRYIINTGERRFRALQMAGITEHQFTVISGDLGSAYDLSVVENRHREDLTVIEEAEAIRRYFAAGRTMAEVVQVMGYSDFTIYKRLELLDLHPDVQAMIIEGKLPCVKALRLRKVPLADQIKKAHLLINGTPLDFDEDLLQRNRKARKVRARIDNPAGAMLSLVMQFAWRSKSVIAHLEELLAMSPEEFVALLKQINVTSRQTLETRFGELAAVSRRLAERLEEMRSGRPLRQAERRLARSVRTAGSADSTSIIGSADSASATEPAKPAPASATGAIKPELAMPVRDPIHFNGAPPPENCGVSGEGRARAEECRSVLRYLFCNSPKHGSVNLSRERLRRVLALPTNRNPEDLALGVLRVAWANWGVDPKSIQPGPQRELLEMIANLRNTFGSSFSEAINVAWRMDVSLDPIDLGKLVPEQKAA